MKRIVLALMLCAAAGSAMAQDVALLYEHSVPQAAYAARKLGETLTVQGYRVTQQRTGYEYLISLTEHPEGLSPESLSMNWPTCTLADLSDMRRHAVGRSDDE